MLLLLLTAPVMAQTVTFEWDLHEQAADLAGFTLYEAKTTPVCTLGVPATGLAAYAVTGGSATTTTITPVKPGRKYWVLTAKTPDNIESACSNEVSATVKPKAPKNLRNTLVAVLTAPIRGLVKLAGLFDHKNLRIKKG
jgi:hypothetical protein